MSYTKATLRTATLDMADARVGAVVSPYWDVTPGGEVDRKIGMVFDREWKRILNANRFYAFQKITVSTDVNGRIAKTALNTGAGDSIKRFYRVIFVKQGTQPYTFSKFTDAPLGEDLGSSPYVWYQEGSSLMFLPKAASTSFDIYVNYYPQRPDKLSGEGIAVDFPEEFEELIPMEAAAWMLTKGGTETTAAGELRAGAEDIRADMLQDVARISTTPDRMEFPDHPFDWAG